MRLFGRAIRPARVLAAAAALLVLAAASGCTRTDTTKMDAIANDIQTALAQRPDVVRTTAVYQDNLNAPAQVSVNATVKPGTDFEPVIDAALRLVWQSKLHPLRDIHIGVIDAQDLQRGTNRYINPQTEKAELDRKYGSRPPA